VCGTARQPAPAAADYLEDNLANGAITHPAGQRCLCIRAGFETEQWTLPSIALVIERHFGIRYHPRSLGRTTGARAEPPAAHRPRAGAR
jgi:hypothetical protein